MSKGEEQFMIVAKEGNLDSLKDFLKRGKSIETKNERKLKQKMRWKEAGRRRK